MPQTAQLLRELCIERQLDYRAESLLFLNHRGIPLTRFGVRYVLAKHLERAKANAPERSVWLTGLYNMLFLGGVAVVFIIFPEPIIRLFTNDPEVVPFGVDCLRIIS